ncbi:MAG: DmsC/YnfH family molybdoenzyme membrane anchor subunit [Nitrospirota bacterium]
MEKHKKSRHYPVHGIADHEWRYKKMWWLRSPMVGNMEFSLVLFTVLSQMAVGVVVFLLFTRLTRKEEAVTADFTTLTQQVVFISLALIIVGGLASLAHLGQIARAYRALFLNLSSWMGKEALFLGLFSLSLVVYAGRLMRGGSPNVGLEFVAAVTGILGILSSSLVYAVLNSVPSWNNVFSILFFILTFVLTGASLFGTIIAYKLSSGQDGVKSLAQNYMKSFAALLMPVLIAAMLVTFGYIFYLGSRGPEATSSMNSMLGNFFFWLRVIVGFLGPIFLIAALKKLIKSGETAKAASYVYGVFILLLAGEVLGRILFFSSSVMHTIGGNGTPY